MRKWNAVISILILILFLVHGIFGAFQMFGVGSNALKTLAWAAVALIVLHMLIGIRLTIDTLKAGRRAGISYFRENALFWARRISGFALVLLIGLHMVSFGYSSALGYRLRYFGKLQLAEEILLAAALAVHLLSNIRPLLIGLGLRGFKQRMGEILLVLSVLLLFMAAAMVVYFIRWNTN